MLLVLIQSLPVFYVAVFTNCCVSLSVGLCKNMRSNTDISAPSLTERGRLIGVSRSGGFDYMYLYIFCMLLHILIHSQLPVPPY